MAKGTVRDLSREAEWRRRLRQQAESGQSIRGWCRRHRVTETAFYWWRRELARRDEERQDSNRRDAEDYAASFVPVRVTDASAPTGDRSDKVQHAADRLIDADALIDDGALIEIVLTDGRRVRVAGSVNSRTLAAVLEALALTDAAAAERRAC